MGRPDCGTNPFNLPLLLLAVLNLCASLFNQVIVTVQKLGYQVTDATMMYAILCTSLPGLLNPLLLGLLYKDYRQGYRHVLLRLCCCCCPRNGDLASAMKGLFMFSPIIPLCVCTRRMSTHTVVLFISLCKQLDLLQTIGVSITFKVLQFILG